MFALYSSFEEAYLNDHKTNDLESLHVEMYHYRIGNRGMVIRQVFNVSAVISYT